MPAANTPRAARPRWRCVALNGWGRSGRFGQPATNSPAESSWCLWLPATLRYI